MKKITIGILAHVDAGKTSLSEALLYKSGAIRQPGRVDKRDTLLDSDVQERARGITIFSKCARFETENTEFVLLDTPGHVDFSTETERVLSVLDCCILVISGSEGVQSHTLTLWRMLRSYKIPVYIFVNKTDMPGFNKNLVLSAIKAQLSSYAVDFSAVNLSASVSAPAAILEEIAVCDEKMTEDFLENGSIGLSDVKDAIAGTALYPVFFGSALKFEGIDTFLNSLDILVSENSAERFLSRISGKKVSYEETREVLNSNDYALPFLAKVFKIGRDENDSRLVYMKIFCGSLAPKTRIGDEKIQQLRLYSAEKYKNAAAVSSGDIVTVTGLEAPECGDILISRELALSINIPAAEDNNYDILLLPDTDKRFLEPLMSYRLILPAAVDAGAFLPKLRLLEEEDPTLSVVSDEFHHDILMHVMGKVHMEILKTRIKDRFGVEVDFANGKIIYKETIASKVEGAGHFEPLRHYAEAHLMLEPGEPGSGITLENACSSDFLPAQYQKQILSALAAKRHRGVLTGSVLTDVKITLLSGKSHVKHTEGGDFRQAALRAVRQGLMQAKSVLLEPYYAYVFELPTDCVGRAMTELERRGADINISENTQSGDTGMTVLTGFAPASEMADYGLEAASYTRGLGNLALSPAGYRPCHNADEVIALAAYDPAADLRNPSSSVFCGHGSAYTVEWDEAANFMHVPYTLKERVDYAPDGEIIASYPYGNSASDADETVSADGDPRSFSPAVSLGTDDVDAILNKTFYANSNRSVKNAADRHIERRDAASEAEEALKGINKKSPAYKGTEKPYVPEESYLLVDGYNVIFAWEELRGLAAVNIDGARGRLLDILCDYQSQRGMNLIVVFDAYRVKGHDTEQFDYHNIHVVYTKTAETADRFIERFATAYGSKNHVRVVTSDGVEQIIIRGNNCALTSSREFETEVRQTGAEVSEFVDGKIF